MVAFYIDEFICDPQPTTTSVEGGQTPAPEVGFVVFPSQVTLALPIGDGPGEVLLPPGAVTERSVVEVTEFDYNPRIDGEPDGEWRIASKVIKFKIDNELDAAIRFRVLIDNSLTYPAPPLPCSLLIPLSKHTESLTVLCECWLVQPC